MIIAVIVVIVLLTFILILAATKPDHFRVERSTVINAPPERIYPLIADFRAWRAWSPWENLDPALQRTYSGAEEGRGAIYAWQGNKKAGAGRMEIVEAVPPHRLLLDLDFALPFKAHNQVEFTLEPASAASKVSWVMLGPMTFASKLITIFVNMDSMVGKDFEKGLANLKAAAEARALE